MNINRASGALVEFAFTSKVRAGMPLAAIVRLVRQAWRDNTAAGLTGSMSLCGEEVRQVVEGSIEAVLPLATRILGDNRHHAIRVLAFGPIPARRHVGWHVAGLGPQVDECALMVVEAANVVCLHGRSPRISDPAKACEDRCAFS